MKDIILVSHCMLNTFSKVESFGEEEGREEARRKVMQTIIENGIGIIQLPCPELIMYGTKRWGHVKNQFDTPHFRNVCRCEFEIYLQQLQEYINNGYNIIGILGIDGSPSCGVDLTCVGDWRGEIGSNPNLRQTIDSIKYVREKGVLIDEISKVLSENGIELEMFGFQTETADDICERIKNSIK